jgi:hypothetical protein
MKVAAELAVEDAAHVDSQRVVAVEQRLTTLAEAIAQRYFLQGPRAVRPGHEVEIA